MSPQVGERGYAVFSFKPAHYLLMAALLGNVGSYWWGYSRGEAYQSAIRDRAAAEILAEQEKQMRAEYELQLSEANDAVRDLRAEKADIEARATELEERIDYVTSHYRPNAEAPAQQLPACRFTRGFVGLYNAAITPVVPMPGTGASTGADRKAGTAEAADALILSPLRQPDILHHITGYGARCQAIEAQLNSLIDYLQQVQGRRDD